jgi:hypothetical protein
VRLSLAQALKPADGKARLSPKKAQAMARIYNLFISSIIVNSTHWTLDNGHRTIVATMGITLDGTMRNRVGEVAEDRVRRLVLEWLLEKRLVVEPPLTTGELPALLPKTLQSSGGVSMKFGSDPDIAFEHGGQLKATVEIKGGIDPAGALERYGAAKKSFEHAGERSSRRRNFYLGGVFTGELQRRISADRLFDKTYSIVSLLNDASVRRDFFWELFHHTLRLV